MTQVGISHFYQVCIDIQHIVSLVSFDTPAKYLKGVGDNKSTTKATKATAIQEQQGYLYLSGKYSRECVSKNTLQYRCK